MSTLGWEWANAWALWFVAGLPVWWWWRMRRRWRRALPHSLAQFIAARSTQQGSWRLWVLEAGWSLALLAMIVALARPRWPDPQARIPHRALAWMLVVDVSGSMAERDYLSQGQPISRWEVAKRLLQSLLRGELSGARREDLVGLVTFAVFVQDLAPPTANYTAILSLLERAQPISAPPESATNIGDALVTALYLLRHTAVPNRRILLISDGEHNVPEEILRNARHPVEAAQLARSLGIAIDTIRVGPVPEQLEDVRLRRDAEVGRQILRDVSELTGGIALEAPDSAALANAVQKWDKLTRPVIARPEYYRYREAYPGLALLALVFLLATGVAEWKLGVLVP